MTIPCLALLGCGDPAGASSSASAARPSASASAAQLRAPEDPLLRKELAVLPIPSQQGEELGTGLAISGKRIVVTADHHRSKEGDAAAAGRVIIGTWTDGKLQIEADIQPTEQQQIGTSVAIAGKTVVAGARYADGKVPGSGAVVVFEQRDGAWAQTAKLVPDDGHAEGYFGGAVGTTDEVIAIGSPGGRAGVADPSTAGALHVYERAANGWAQRSVIVGASAGRLGTSVAIAGRTIAAGAPFEDGPGSQPGAVHVYGPGAKGWAEEARLVAEDAHDHGSFGESVALDGDTLAVGAVGLDETTSAVYVFVRADKAWKQQVKLAAPPGSGAFFGGAVALSGDTLVVGATFANEERGGAYVYRRTGATWKLVAKLVASDGSPKDWLGQQVAVGSGVMVVSAVLRGDRTGAAYLFPTR